jgi:predicted enzyme related to lactoylglutathione lyase
MEQRISLVTLDVTDLARARSFYEAMGWGGAQQPDEEVCFFQAGGMVLGLWTALGGHGASGIELAQNVRAPEEVAEVLAEAEQAGGKIVRPAALAEWGGMSGAVADLMATCGKSRTTRAGPSPTTGPSVSDICSCGRSVPATIPLAAPCRRGPYR